MPPTGESQLQLTDIGQPNDQTSEIEWGDPKKLRVAKSTVLAVCAGVVVLLVVVIIAVYFAHPDYGKPEYIQVTSSPGQSPYVMVDRSDLSMAVHNFTITSIIMKCTVYYTRVKITLTTVGSTAVPTDVRLPTSLTPIRYDVRLRPDIYSNQPDDFSFTGSITMKFQVVESTHVITLHYRKLEIDGNQISVQNGLSEITVTGVSTDESREFYLIHLSEALTPGTECTVSMKHFEGPLEPDLTGIYYSSYLASDNTTHYLVTSHLQPTDARKVFPCLDEPQLKAIFGFTIERKSSYQSMSNTRIKDTLSLGDDWYSDAYEDTPVMSSYILALVVSDFECSTADNTSVTPPQTTQPTSLSLILSASHVAVPDFAAGAMENWGLIIYRETALLFDPLTASAANKQRVAVVVTHELAHMWFGNLVTPSWWDDIWLNEGFASYMEYTGLSDMYPEWEMENQFVVNSMQYVFALDGLASSHPIYQTVNHPSEISQIFDSITYYKGSCVIRMMKFFLGEETFRKGISKYLSDKSYQAAHHDELFDALAEQAKLEGKDIDVRGIMATWIRQMGYPVVNFTYDSATGDVKVTQEHFLLDRDQEMTTTSEFDYRWDVPVTYATDENGLVGDPEVSWLHHEEDQVTLSIGESVDWFVGNVRQRGYYRVNYDPESWQRLIDQLNTNHSAIHVQNRAQIIDDSFNLGRSGYVDQMLALNATLYMQDEEEYIPWLAAEYTFTYISRMLALTDKIDHFKEYVQRQVSPIYTTLAANEEDNHLKQLLRRAVVRLACGYGLQSCVNASVQSYAVWMENPLNNTVNQNLRSETYCRAVASGGLKEWQFAREQYSIANSGAEKDALAGAMGCSQNTGALNAFLQMAIEEEEIRRGDFRSVLRAVARNPLGRHLAWNFYKYNYNTIFERFGESLFTMSSMVAEITESFSEEYELYDLEAFSEATTNKGSAEFAFQQAIEKTRINIEWRKQHEENLAKWLDIHSSLSG
ncbi:hypothetical protein CAPTEDRAFT_209320 [Capitella teleta]|uniref:Aminopeptidase n=1 Tax=Capitella teleta TaxID=283909 RepID=R7U3Q4_CAPTE|nr:hypothetical protein CAPTEDRAFT_209320 [Capitella teleta]|eukprot:ELU00955.1 hypothetical protein CAPTEDRAFT_209320 [Capitella teleta]